MAHYCKPLKTWWSLNRLKERGFKFGDGAKEKIKNSWESCRFKYYHKYSSGDDQRAAIPDLANKQKNKQ